MLKMHTGNRIPVTIGRSSGPGAARSPWCSAMYVLYLRAERQTELQFVLDCQCELILAFLTPQDAKTVCYLSLSLSNFKPSCVFNMPSESI